MKKAMITATMIVLALFGTSSAATHREWRGGYGNGPGNVPDVAGVPGLNLSAEQRERVVVLREAHLRDIKPLQEQLMGKSRQLRELWLAKTPDRERILALQREVHDLRGRLIEKLTAYRLGVMHLLTPDQRNKVQAFETERYKGARGPGMGHGPFPGRPESNVRPGGPFRERHPAAQSKPNAEGAQGTGETVVPANR